MKYRNISHTCRLAMALCLMAVCSSTYALPVAVPDEAFPALEDGFASGFVDVSAKFSDPVIGHTIVGYAYVGSTGPDTIASVGINTASGMVTLTPIADAYGTETYEFSATDDDLLGAQTATWRLTMTLAPVNDVPSFTAGANQTVLEGAGAQTVAGWATGLSTGPANESTQSLAFNVTGNTNPGLFSVAPAVDGSSGDLTYTLAADASGSANITLNIQDDGGIADGGVDTSADQTFTISVTGVNDAPGFAGGGDATALEDAGAQTVGGWATGMTPGPADEAGQTLTFNVTANTNPGLFAAGLAVDATTGDLTYTPAPDAFGTANITLNLSDDGGTADGGIDTSADVSFTITVDEVNDVPSFTSGGDVTMLEDAGAQTFAGWATGLLPGAANEAGQGFTFNIVGNSNPALFDVLPAVDGVTGDLTFTAAVDGSGAAVITLNIQDNGGTANGGVDTSANQTFTITATDVNDAPGFGDGGDVTALEDAGAQTVSGWATGMTPGPADEAGQALTFNVTANTNPTLFSAAPAVDATTGDLTYTPAPDAFGTANITLNLSDDGGTADGGIDTSADLSFSITVDEVNDVPSFIGGGDVALLEDAGAQTFGGWATGLLAGPANESGQGFTFNIVSNSNPTLFDVLPAVDGVSGDLTFSAVLDGSGAAVITLNIQDDGGTANGGIDTSADQTFTITVTGVNDAPGFVVGADQILDEDMGPQSIPGWATGMSAGPADESAQLLNFNVVGNSNAALFSVVPTVDATTGELAYTPTADANGSAIITLNISDSGGTANGGIDTSADQTFTISIGDVNDVPSFVAGADQTVLEDAGGVTVPAWATGLSAGPMDESAQTLTFNVLSNSNPGLFDVPPAVDGVSGDLTFTPAADINGTATITLTVADNGGTANGGVDTSAPQVFDIDVTSVNDAPTFTVGPDINVAEDAGAQSFPGWASGMSPGPADESGQALTFNVVGNSNPALFSSAPAVDEATGTLTFTSTADANGLATITLNLSDDGGSAAGGSDTSPDQTFVIDVAGVNDLPVAGDDSQIMVEDSGPILIAVLDNDYLAEEPTTITAAGVGGYSESPPTSVLDQQGDPISDPNGAVSIVGNMIEYEPKEDFYGDDYFSYTVTDVNGDTSTATVRVTVTPVNDPPVGVQERTYSMLENGSLTVDAGTGLLVGTYDVEGALLDASGNPMGATLSIQVVAFPIVGSLSLTPATGTFDYTPPVDFIGEVTFEYRVSDGTDLSSGSAYRVRIVVIAAPPPAAPPPAGEVSITYELANSPLENSPSVPPNVLVVMDDSGSMDWNMIVAGTDQNGGFVIDNSTRANSGKRNTGYVYLWDLPNNAYSSTSGNGRIAPTEEALEADGKTDGNEYGVWRARNHLTNRLYYNPRVTYTPWIGQDAINAEFTDADPDAIRLQPVDPTNTFDLLAPHSYTADNVPEWDNNGGTEDIDVDDLYIPRYYATTGTAPLAWDDPHSLIEIRAGSGPLAGDRFPGGAQREDCAVGDGNPLDCTYAQEIQNFANYFQYYRSREYVTKNGVGKVVAQLQDIRVGYETISDRTSEPVREMNSLHTEGDKKVLMDTIYEVDSFGGTPLREALGRAGEIFSCTTGPAADCPSLPAPEGFCQQNFALLFTDGYWNGGTDTPGNEDTDGAGPFDGGRYADGVNATLADVAMYYYERDIRPGLIDEVPVMRRDLDGAPAGTFPGTNPLMHQHMKTYTVSFGVTGTVDPASVPANPTTPFAWPDPFDGAQEKIDDMLHTAINGRGRFLNAASPQELQAAFESAFLEFTQAASSTSSAAFNSTSLQDGTLLYRGFYDLRGNTGELTATQVNADGTLAPAPVWRASDRLDPAFTLPNNRVLVTFDPVAQAGTPFRHVSLTPEQQLTLNAQQVDYLRGGRTGENPVGPLRERPTSNGLLGDIVNSSPVFVGPPRSFNRDQAPFPVSDLYSEFVDAVDSRTPLVYVGANDGMMHGFNALTGDEMFAYVPNKIIDGSQAYGNSLDEFTSPFYQHKYYVDLTPRLNDVYMGASPASLGRSWNSVLVGGLGAGGKGLYALNVTHPDTAFSSEANASGSVLWEFTDQDDTYPVDGSGTPLGGFVGAMTDPLGRPVKDLGYTLSLPTVAMSNVDGGGAPPEKEWVAVFGNGPNSTAGIAKLFVLFMHGGLDGWGPGDVVKLDTGFGVPSAPHPLAGYPNGLGTPAGVDRDLNGTVDWVYAGDRLGNLFRFDISDPDTDNWTVTRLFTATFDTGSGDSVQPILTQPLVIKHPTEQGFLVIFGTGSHLTREDSDSEDIQSIYAIWDRGAAAPATALASTKQLRLVEQTITNVVDDASVPAVTRRIVSKNAVNYTLEGIDPGTYGWYIDLDMPRAANTLSGAANSDISGRSPPGPQFPGEKAIRRMLFRDGAVITTTLLPSLDEFSCFGTRPGSILLFDAVTGGDAGRPVVDFNTDGYVESGDLVNVAGEAFAAGLLFNQSDLSGALVDLSTLGGEGETDFLFVSGGDETVAFRIEDVNDSRTGRLSWHEIDAN